MGPGGFSGRRGREICTIEVAWDTERCTGALLRRLCTLENIDERVSTLASLQGGVISRCQLLALGISADQIKVRLRRHWLIPLHIGVYAVGHADLSPRGRGMAALLAAGPGSALAQDTAAGFWELSRDTSGKPHVIVPPGHSRKRNTLHVHSPQDLRPGDIDRRFGLLLTSPTRTVLDVAPNWPHDRLARAIREGRVLGRIDVQQLRARSQGRRGATAIRAALDAPTSEPTRSQTEALFARLIAQTDLPRPAYNERVNGKRRDAYWHDHAFIAEFDAISTHADPITFESDRARDNQAAMHDLESRRFTRTALRDDPMRVLTTIAYRLGARSH